MQHGKALRAVMLAALSITGICPAPANGQVPGDRPVYSLQRAIDLALSSNPGLRAAGLEIEVARSERDLAALPAAMSIQAEAENFLGTGDLASFDSAETTLQLSRVLELGGKRELRERLGSARVGLAETERDTASLELAAEVARRFIRLVALQEEAEVADQGIGLAQNTLAIVVRGVEIGRNSAAELATAEITLAQAQLARDAIALRLDAAQGSLASLWGAEQQGELYAQAALFDLPALPPLERLQARVADSPALLRTVDERRILEAERQLAESRGRSDLALDFGVRHLAATGDAALVFGASLPLGRRDRARAGVAAAGTSLEQLSAGTAQRRLDLVAALGGLHAELSTAHQSYVAFRDSILPRSEDAARLYREGFELGSVSLLEFNQAQQDHLTLLREALAAAARYHATLVEIEQLLGGTLATGVIQ